MQTFRRLLTALALTTAAPVHAGLDILACSTKLKEAVTPTDTLQCEWKNGVLTATLAQLYGDGWRLIEVAFFEGNREVLYLERPEPAAAATGPVAAPAAP